MDNNDFVWTDLSTFDLANASEFYAELFGWRFRNEDGYHMGCVGANQAAGIYVMPDKFQAMGLPSFWMSYILSVEYQRCG